MARRTARRVDGIVLLDKPQGLSSNQALQQVKRIYHAAKAGHTGSLDPMATGLLPLCFGEATKIAGLLLGSRKSYLAECLLGIRTNTDDAEGTVVAERTVPVLERATIEQALQSFVGIIDQVPPAFSALKRDGVPMYVRARRGEAVELDARSVTIDTIQLLDWQSPRLVFRVTCGSGTYIRSLARDLGEYLGCGAHLTALRRQWVEPFVRPVMHGLEALREADEAILDQCLLPVDAGLTRMPAIQMDAAASADVAHGRAVAMPQLDAGHYRAYAEAGHLLAMVECRADGCLHVLRGFNLVARP